MDTLARLQVQEERAETLAEWLEVHNGRLTYRPEDDPDYALWNFSVWSAGHKWLALVGNGRPDNPGLRAGAESRADRCGTQACAGGWATLVFPKLLEFDNAGEFGAESVRPAKALLLECESMDEARRLDGAGVRDVMQACFGATAPFINTKAYDDDGEAIPTEPRHVARALRHFVAGRRDNRDAERRLRIRQEEDQARLDLRAGQDKRTQERQHNATSDTNQRCHDIGDEPAWEPPEPVINAAAVIGSAGLGADSMPASDVAWDDPARNDPS